MTPEQIYAAKYSGKSKENTGKSGGFASKAVAGKPLTKTKYIQPGLPGPLQKISDVGLQIGRFGGMVAGKTGSFIKNSAVDIYQAGFGTARTFIDVQNQPIQNKILAEQSKQLGVIQSKVMSEYSSGKMSKENYLKALGDLNEAFKLNNQENQKISAGPTPQQRAMDVVETAVNLLTLGSAGLVRVGVKQAYEAGGTAALKALVKEAATPLEQVAMKVPAVQALIIRNLERAGIRQAQKVAGETAAQYIAREGKTIAVNLLIKRPVFYQANIAEANKFYHGVLDKNTGGALASAAWLGVQMIEGGPLGVAARGAGWLKRTTGKLAYGKGSFIDEISKKIGNGNPSQIARFLTTLEKRAPNEFKEAEKTFRILQETNLRAGGSLDQAVDNVLTHYAHNDIPLDSITPGQLYRDMNNWAKADELAQRLLSTGKIKGVDAGDAQKYVVVRWDKLTKQAVADTVAAAGNKSSQRAAIQALADRPGVGWGNNDILMKRINKIISESKSGEEAAQAIRQIETASTHLKGVPTKASRELAKLGFTIAEPYGGRKTPIVSYGETRKLVSGALDNNTEIFDPAIAPQPEVAMIAGALQKIGLSPEAASRVGTQKLGESVVASINELGFAARLGFKNDRGNTVNGGRAILATLQNYIENKRGAFGIGGKAAITDVRQLTLNEIEDALKIGKAEARAISAAIMDGYTRVPLELRGLGDKIVDTLYRVNPLHKYYSRFQAAARYTYNPFFRTQERVETKLLSHAQGSNLVWIKPRNYPGSRRQWLDEGTQTLDEAGIFTSSLPGEAAQDQVLGRITANITAGQKRDLAGLAYQMAEARGLTLKQMVAEHSDEIDDALRVVVQYPTKGVLASPLARTMNLMFFPMRYNIKVSQIAAQVLAKQPPAVQMAVIHSGFKLRDWLKSDEGITWQSQHADAIQVLSWLTPVNSIAYTLNLLSHRPDSVAELGQLGGLPLGFITQALDNQGIINLNRPYVNPKTGDILPDYIPKTVSARTSVALTDLLGSLFTYPGRILGLPGKGQLLRDGVKAYITTNGSDFDKQVRTEDLTELQKDWIRVLKGDSSNETMDRLYNSPAPGQFNWYTIPPTDLPIIASPTSPVSRPAKRTGLPTKAKGPKKKKIPAAIPPR